LDHDPAPQGGQATLLTLAPVPSASSFSASIWLREVIPERDLEVFIYDDGAMRLGPNVDKRFEKPDYDTQRGLIAEFLAALAAGRA